MNLFLYLIFLLISDMVKGFDSIKNCRHVCTCICSSWAVFIEK